MRKLLNIEFSSLRQIKTDNVVLKIDMSDFQKGGGGVRPPPPPLNPPLIQHQADQSKPKKGVLIVKTFPTNYHV